MKIKFGILFIGLIIITFSCNNQNTCKNTTKAKNEIVKPVILSKYPYKIDSILNSVLKEHYNKLNVDYEISDIVVGHGIVHQKKMIGDSIVFDGDVVDYEQFEIKAKIKTEDKIENWDLLIDEKYKTIVYLDKPKKETN